MRSKLANIGWGVAGFGLCKTSLSIAYLTAMGSVSSTVGFVSELSFMVPMLVSSFVVALAVVALVARGRLPGGSLMQVPAVAALVAGFSLSAVGVLSQVPAEVAAGLCGVLCGFAYTVLNAAWLEVFACEPRTSRAAAQMAGGFVVQCVLVLLLLAAPPAVARAASVAAVVASAVVLARLRGASEFPARRLLAPRRRSDRLRLARALLCVFVLVAVVGVLHTAVLGSQAEHVVGDVSMGLPLAVATGIAVLLAVIASHCPNPTAVYRGCLPVLLVTLSLLPFFGEALGGLVGMAVITCYDVCGMVVLIYLAECARRLEMSAYGLSCLYLAGSSLSLLIGLEAGVLVRSLSADLGLSLLTLLAFAALYPLAAVLMLLLRPVRDEPSDPRRSEGSAAEAAVGEAAAAPEGTAGPSEEPQPAYAPTQTPDDVLAARIEALADAAALTRREREIAGYLARGRSAKFISQELVISENTTWAHIKRIYAKTGVHGKQEFMSAVEERPTQ